VVRAITNIQCVGVINSEEIMPEVFIGNCLVKPEEGTCPISVINTTKEQVAIPTPLVSIEEIPETVPDNADKPVLHMTQREDKKPPQARKEQLKNLIRTEHLNEKEKKFARANLRRVLRYILFRRRRVNLHLNRIA